jgi:hypothetical protein
MLQRVAPVILIREVVASVEFRKERAGFECDEVFCNPPNFAMQSREAVTLMLAQAPKGQELPPPNWRVLPECNQICIWADDVNSLYAEVQQRGAPIDFTIYYTSWGTREFGIQDLEVDNSVQNQTAPSERNASHLAPDYCL